MSAIIMHNHFSKIVYNGLDENVKNAVNNVNLYEFAANGPDPFKYHRFLNKKQRIKYKEIWNTMNNKNVKAFIYEMAQAAKLNKDLFPYLCGYITYYYLSALTSPYIYHKSGVYDPQVNNSIKYRGLHLKLVRAMDAYIIENYFNANPNTFNVLKILKLKRLPKTISQDINIIYEKVYDMSNAYKVINHNIKYQKIYYWLIHDSLGVKNKLLSKFDKGKSLIDLNYISFYNKGVNIRKFDIFNFKHDRWFNPVDDTITSIDSFFDLFDKAKKISLDAINALYKMIYLDEDVNLDQYILDISMVTGLPLSKGTEMKYFNNIFK